MLLLITTFSVVGPMSSTLHELSIVITIVRMWSSFVGMLMAEAFGPVCTSVPTGMLSASASMVARLGHSTV